MSVLLRSTIIAELKQVATVDVKIGEETSLDPSIITIDEMKMNEVMAGYNYLNTLVHKAWSNLPTPPVKEKTHVFVWFIASRGYCINHSTIRWPGSSPNTFVHLWSIMDRIKYSLTGMDSSWLIGSRDCIQYCSTTGMNWPMDSHMYTREHDVPDQIKMMETRPEIFRYDPTTREYSSFYDFQMSTRVPKKMPIVNVSMMGLSEITRSGLSDSRASRD